MSAPAQPTTTLLLSNAIIGGKFYSAGTPLPFTDESALPESLKAFVASEAAPAPAPFSRNIYDMSPLARRAVRRLEIQAAHQEFAEAGASEPLPPGRG